LGKGWLFYPKAEAALILDVDPVGLVRGKGQAHGLLDQYVNDRPYAASSFLSVALNKTLCTAMTGVSKERQDLVDSELSLVPDSGIAPNGPANQTSAPPNV